MSGFILEYGTEAGGHVTMDLAADKVVYYSPTETAPSDPMTVDEFAAKYPEVVAEMVKNRVLRKK